MLESNFASFKKLCNVFATMGVNETSYCVIQFIEPPYAYKHYVIIPNSWIINRQQTEEFVYVAYPIEDPDNTRERVENNEPYDENWKTYLAIVEYESANLNDVYLRAETMNDAEQSEDGFQEILETNNSFTAPQNDIVTDNNMFNNEYSNTVTTERKPHCVKKGYKVNNDQSHLNPETIKRKQNNSIKVSIERRKLDPGLELNNKRAKIDNVAKMLLETTNKEPILSQERRALETVTNMKRSVTDNRFDFQTNTENISSVINNSNPTKQSHQLGDHLSQQHIRVLEVPEEYLPPDRNKSKTLESFTNNNGNNERIQTVHSFAVEAFQTLFYHKSTVHQQSKTPSLVVQNDHAHGLERFGRRSTENSYIEQRTQDVTKDTTTPLKKSSNLSNRLGQYTDSQPNSHLPRLFASASVELDCTKPAMPNLKRNTNLVSNYSSELASDIVQVQDPCTLFVRSSNTNNNGPVSALKGTAINIPAAVPNLFSSGNQLSHFFGHSKFLPYPANNENNALQHPRSNTFNKYDQGDPNQGTTANPPFVQKHLNLENQTFQFLASMHGLQDSRLSNKSLGMRTIDALDQSPQNIPANASSVVQTSTTLNDNSCCSTCCTCSYGKPVSSLVQDNSVQDSHETNIGSILPIYEDSSDQRSHIQEITDNRGIDLEFSENTLNSVNNIEKKQLAIKNRHSLASQSSQSPSELIHLPISVNATELDNKNYDRQIAGPDYNTSISTTCLLSPNEVNHSPAARATVEGNLLNKILAFFETMCSSTSENGINQDDSMKNLEILTTIRNKLNEYIESKTKVDKQINEVSCTSNNITNINNKQTKEVVQEHNHVDNKHNVSNGDEKSSNFNKKEHDKYLKDKTQSIKKNRKRKSPIQFPRNYDPIDSRWTLNYTKLSPGVVELIPNSRVYVNAARLEHALREATCCKTLARLLLPEIFSVNALSVCLWKGNTVRPALDETAREVFLLYVENICTKLRWPVDRQTIVNTISCKIQQLRPKYMAVVSCNEYFNEQ